MTIHYVEKMVERDVDNKKKYPDKNKNESCCTMQVFLEMLKLMSPTP